MQNTTSEIKKAESRLGMNSNMIIMIVLAEMTHYLVM